jgi:hypothetical protein
MSYSVINVVQHQSPFVYLKLNIELQCFICKRPNFMFSYHSSTQQCKVRVIFVISLSVAYTRNFSNNPHILSVPVMQSPYHTTLFQVFQFSSDTLLRVFSECRHVFLVEWSCVCEISVMFVCGLVENEQDFSGA